jgi:hypothetical protein
MSRTADRAEFSFEGFANPTTTPVPDVVFDRFLSKLGEAELKALLYIIRRTFGFKRDQDPISFNQFLRGITRRDGRVLDEGCGVRDRTTLSRALKSLEAKGIIRSEKGVDERGENETTIYSLRFREDRPEGVVGYSYHPSRNNPPPVVGHSYPQETGLQETVQQETGSKYLPHSSEDISVSNRKLAHELPERREERSEPPAAEPASRTGFATAGALLKQRFQAQTPAEQTQPAQSPARKRGRTSPRIPETPEQQAIRAYIRDLRTRFTDYAGENSSATRAVHLYERARARHPALDVSDFIGQLEHAAAITAERGGELRYLFEVVENLLWPQQEQSRRDTSGYAVLRRRKAFGGELVRVIPPKDRQTSQPGARNRVKIARNRPVDGRVE